MWKLAVALLFGALLAASPATAQTQPDAPSTGLSVDSGMKTLLADPNAKEVIAKYAPAVVEFFTSGQAEGVMPAETPLAVLAQNPMAIDAGLNPENMKKISAALSPR